MNKLERRFFKAATRGDAERLGECLAEHPELARAQDRHGATALHLAARHGHSELFSLLIEAGADVNARDGRHGATPAGWALEPLRELGGLLAGEIEDASWAVKRDDVEGLARLLERLPALADARLPEGLTLRELAHSEGSGEILRLFE